MADVIQQSIPGHSIYLRDRAKVDPECRKLLLSAVLSEEEAAELERLETQAAPVIELAEELRDDWNEDTVERLKSMMSAEMREVLRNRNPLARRVYEFEIANPFIALTTAQLKELRDWLSDQTRRGVPPKGIHAARIGYIIRIKVAGDEQDVREAKADAKYALDKGFITESDYDKIVRSASVDVISNMFRSETQVFHLMDALTAELERRL